MLRITPQKSTAQVQRYYEQSDYYEQGPDALKGHWFGKGAELLGLKGEVNKEQFDRIVENRHPFEDVSLTPKTRADRRIGWDFTFSVPKSVSIAWALSGQDPRYLNIVREAVNETLAEIQQDVLTRVHVGKVMHTEKTGNIIAATWLHTTSRPVDGVPMPGLHVHAWLANATHNGERFKAMDISSVKKDGPYFEARFHSRLAGKIQDEFGFGIERQGKKWFEIQGFPRDIIERYSERTKQIEEEAKRLGVVDAPEKKAELGARTRESKSKTIPPDELTELWRAKLGDSELAGINKGVWQSRNIAKNEHASAKQAVDFAIEHKFAKQSTVRERDLMTDAIWRGIGETRIADIEADYKKRPLIKEGKDEAAWVTTPKVLKEEQWMLHFARKGLGRHSPLATDETIERQWLSDEQKNAVNKVWNSTDRVMIIAGKAGTGKTTIAQEAERGIAKGGHDVLMLAPTTRSVEVLKKDGFAANTLMKFLVNEKLQAKAAGNVIWTDEAGLISSIDMAHLFRLAEKLDARLILAGDRFQHSAVERGKPLELLETETGIKPITINTIRRQEDDGLRQAVEQLSRGDIGAGFSALEKMGAIKVLPDEQRDKALACAYADALEAGESALIIAPTNLEKYQVTESVRDELKRRGRIQGPERQFTTLKAYGWTKAEQQDAKLYSPGDVIEFHARGKGGFKPGERVKVIDVTDKDVMVERGLSVDKLPLSSAGAFSVFRPVVKGFAVGDTIRITRNRRANPGQTRFNNGSSYTIHGFADDGKLRLDRGLNLDPNWSHFDHGVVTTSFSSQGDTKDRVFIAQSSKSFAASSPAQAYVSASRARRSVTIFTDDLIGLREAVSRDRPAVSATELSRKVEQRHHCSRIKQQIARLRHVAARSRAFVGQQVRRISQLTQRPVSTQPIGVSR